MELITLTFWLTVLSSLVTALASLRLAAARNAQTDSAMTHAYRVARSAHAARGAAKLCKRRCWRKSREELSAWLMLARARAAQRGASAEALELYGTILARVEA